MATAVDRHPVMRCRDGKQKRGLGWDDPGLNRRIDESQEIGWAWRWGGISSLDLVWHITSELVLNLDTPSLVYAGHGD